MISDEVDSVPHPAVPLTPSEMHNLSRQPVLLHDCAHGESFLWVFSFCLFIGVF